MVTTISTGKSSAVEASNHSKSVQTPGKPILIPVPKWHSRKNWTDKTICLKYPPFIKYPTIVLSYRELIKKKNNKKRSWALYATIVFKRARDWYQAFLYVIISNDIKQ